MRGHGRVYLPKGKGKSLTWWIDYSVRGKRFRESAHTTSKSAAQRLLREMLSGRETGRLTGTPDRVTFTQLRELVERQYALDGRRSLSTIQIQFRHLAEHFRHDRALDITVGRVDAYATYRLAEGAARATVNRELAALRRGFRLAVKKGLLATRPEFEIPKEHNARQGFFEADDFAAVLAELPAPLRPLVQFMYCTGWRLGEVKRLTWAHVDFAAGVVRLEVDTTKNDEGRVFPFDALPALADVLREQWAARNGLFVFHRAGQPVRDLYAAWHGACRRAAVRNVDGREVIIRPALLERIPHDFRRTAVRNLERAGVPRSVAMQLTGHKTESVYRRYAIVVERDLREGVAKLAALSGKPAAHFGDSVASQAQVS